MRSHIFSLSLSLSRLLYSCDHWIFFFFFRQKEKMNKLFSFLLLSIFFLFVISFSSQIITSVKIAPLGVDLKQEDESSTVPSEADVEDQFEVEKCNASLAKKCSAKQSGFRKGFTKCWFGTTEKNIYCCNQTKLGDRKPGRNDLFAPSNCCVPNGVYLLITIVN